MVAGYAVRESVRRRVFPVVLVLTVAFLGLYGFGVYKAYQSIDPNAVESVGNGGLIDTQIGLYREGREETILGMKQLQEIAYAMREAVEGGDVDELGAMLRDAFVAKRRMNPHIAEHTPIEAMLSMAHAAGASGGKICGAGGGGYLLLYCRPSAQRAVREELVRLGGQFTPFTFRTEGVRAFRGDEVWAPTNGQAGSAGSAR